jgi:CRP-like cAMP-binding protein
MPGATPEDLSILAGMPLFRGLGELEIGGLIEHASILTAPNRKTLFVQGDLADRFYVILDGWVKLSRLTKDGEQAVIAVFTRAESFGEAVILESREFPATAEVVAPSRLLVVPAAPFLRVLRTNNDLALNMLASMSRRLHYLVQQVEQLQAKSAPQRVGNFLLPLLPELDGPVTVLLPYDKSLIAARLGMKPETFSRALGKLRKVGVRAEGSAVIVPRPKELQKFCEA